MNRDLGKGRYAREAGGDKQWYAAPLSASAIAGVDTQVTT